MKRLIVLLLALALAVTVLGCQSATQQTETSGSADQAASSDSKEPIKIGVILSATGPSSPLGEPEKKTMEMEEEAINAAGGINGRDIELIIIDDQSEPKNAAVGATKLIEQDKVIAIIGATTSASSLAIKPEADKNEIPQISMAAGAPITQEPKKWVFRTAQSDVVAVQKVLDYLKDGLKIKSFAILHDANAFGQSGATELQKLAPDMGLQITGTEAYKTEDTNMTAQLTNIKGTNPDAVVVWGTNPGPAIAAKNMKQLNMTMPYVGSHGIANTKFIELAGDASEGVVFPASKILVPESAQGEQGDVIKGFMEDYQAKYNQPPNSFAGHAYDALHILVNALKEAGDDKAKLRDAIEKTSGFNGVTGVFEYSADNHDGTSTKDMIMVEVKGGAWQEKQL